MCERIGNKESYYFIGEDKNFSYSHIFCFHTILSSAYTLLKLCPRITSSWKFIFLAFRQILQLESINLHQYNFENLSINSGIESKETVLNSFAMEEFDRIKSIMSLANAIQSFFEIAFSNLPMCDMHWLLDKINEAAYEQLGFISHLVSYTQVFSQNIKPNKFTKLIYPASTFLSSINYCFLSLIKKKKFTLLFLIISWKKVTNVYFQTCCFHDDHIQNLAFCLLCDLLKYILNNVKDENLNSLLNLWILQCAFEKIIEISNNFRLLVNI